MDVIILVFMLLLFLSRLVYKSCHLKQTPFADHEMIKKVLTKARGRIINHVYLSLTSFPFGREATQRYVCPSVRFRGKRNFLGPYIRQSSHFFLCTFLLYMSIYSILSVGLSVRLQKVKELRYLWMLSSLFVCLQ